MNTNEQAMIEEGGPAFPVVRMPLDPDTILNRPGMTLRDWFAGQALAGSLASQTPQSHWAFAQMEAGATDDQTVKGIAQLCYDIADAMLERRKK